MDFVWDFKIGETKGIIMVMKTILESNKSLWQRTGNMALVVIGAISIFLATFEEINLYALWSY